MKFQHADPSRPHAYRCPSCGGRLWRQPRHLIDFVISAFRPMWRFNCRFIACQWQGRLPVLPEDLEREPQLDRHGVL
ncbi:hypothetical protein PFX98_00220 [Paucibacter sediminis]|uniref:Uncharacterized protein n=1 Tax=Paucibacter sediminis TaxID=3019553 RepID=A0AA95NJK2_9BURK|nr:hypothetical protein [Paucibacter sp. S2-9]WIT12061.1 hypothetical protein PFX98_00220 [Paucibacter sp. S2-9]